MRKTLLALILLVVCTTAMANTREKKSLFTGYTGGMMVHLGYAWGGNLTPTGLSPIAVRGVSTGIGGRIVFGLGPNYRIGSEGYVSTINYGDKRKASVGWGGLTMDWGWDIGKFRPYFGCSFGYGTYENMTAVAPPLNDNTPQLIVWHEYSTLFLTPFLACEYSITKRIKAHMRIDWITAPLIQCNEWKDFSSGPRIHIGFMFGH